MTILLSLLCGLFACFLLIDRFFLSGAIYALFPLFTATAAALCSVIIAGLEYRTRKSKKKRRAPMACILISALAGIVATALWIMKLMA